MQTKYIPTRVKVDGSRGEAGADAIMVADGHSIELAACQIWYPAAGCGRAAAEKSLVFIHNSGSVGVQCGLTKP